MKHTLPALAVLIMLLGGMHTDASAQTSRSTAIVDTTGTGGFFASFDGTRIYYRTHGNGHPVILVHGFMGTSEGWEGNPLQRALLKAGLQVISLDLRGNGKSDRPHELSAYQHDAEARDIMNLATHLGLQRYAIAGYSRGSIITARVLVLDRRVTSAVLGGMGADFTNPDWPRRIQFYHALRGDSIPELAEMVQHVREAGLDQQALAAQQGAQPSTGKEELAGVHVPVLVISGDQDSDNGSAMVLAGLIPGSMHVTVPGKHGDTWRSEPFAHAVATFLMAH